MPSPSVPSRDDRLARLKRSADFQRVQKTGRRFRGRWLVLVACPGTGAGSRLGFAVSRRVGNAVARNRVKRWLREASREATCTRSWDLVLIANAGAAEAGWLPLAAEVRSLLARAAP